MHHAKIRQYVSALSLHRFRSYPQLSLKCDHRPVILTGANGAGKTNILEAISLLMPGRGLRKATLENIDYAGEERKDIPAMPWAVAATLHSLDGEHRLGVGRERLPESGRSKRVMKLNGEIVKQKSDVAELCTVIWLTPQMDGVFIDGTASRRNFLDRLVYHFDAEHASRVNAYEYAMRERAKLLQQRTDPFWLASVEKKMAETAIAIAAARIDTLGMIQQTIMEANTIFPKAQLSVEGWVEDKLQHGVSALEVESLLEEELQQKRTLDRESGRTHSGTHRSHFNVFHMEKQMIAEHCSTGEQKALLLSIVLAEAKARTAWRNTIPILLLDEVVAHLDKERRQALFEEILTLGAQTWMTGTELTLFDGITECAQCMEVKEGKVNI